MGAVSMIGWEGVGALGGQETPEFAHHKSHHHW